MANDPGLANDTCIFMEALPHDGGASNLSDICRGSAGDALLKI
jgi:hypothetical protein